MVSDFANTDEGPRKVYRVEGNNFTSNGKVWFKRSGNKLTATDDSGPYAEISTSRPIFEISGTRVHPISPHPKASPTAIWFNIK